MYNDMTDHELRGELWASEYAIDKFAEHRITYETALVSAGRSWVDIATTMHQRLRFLRSHITRIRTEMDRREKEKETTQAQEAPPCAISADLYARFLKATDALGEAYDKSPDDKDMLRLRIRVIQGELHEMLECLR